ncbi:MAG: type III-B CRISPR module RAMP protein Cmr1 [Thermoproteota archaeon]
MSTPIAKINLENLTYLIPGGYNAAPFSAELDLWELPRAQSFKGLWRWWLRALLSGALWESGKLDEAKVQEATGKLLGSTEQASKLTIQVATKGSAIPISSAFIKKWKSQERQLRITPNCILTGFPQITPIPSIPPRLFLLLQATEVYERLAEKISCYPPSTLEITVELLKRPFVNLSSEECRVAVSALLLSLTFGGIGAITKRGFGSLSLISIDLHEDLQEYKQIMEEIKEAKEPNVTRNCLNKLVQESLADAQELLSVKGTVAPKEAPEYPVLSMPGNPPQDVKSFNLNVFKMIIPDVTPREEKAFQLLGFKDYETMKLLTIIGYSTTKLFWKYAENKKFFTRGLPYDTWIMGLPRGQEFKKERLSVPYFEVELSENSIRSNVQWDTLNTGYSVDNKNRRTSAISIVPIKRLDKYSWIVALYGFLSRDWPDTLYHYGVSPPPKLGVKKYEVRKTSIRSSQSVRAFIQAWNMVKMMYGVM